MPGSALPRTYRREMERLENLTRRFAGNDDNISYRRQLCGADLDVIKDVIQAHFQADDPDQEGLIASLTKECFSKYLERVYENYITGVSSCGLSNFTDRDLDGLWWDLYQTRLATGAVPAGALEFAGKVLEGIRRWIANGGHRQGLQAQQ